ncbi:molybdopterin molybdotransferase MoeA [Limnohabitans parvus]|uniref:Molybdopterin molybdenumtransferase n=1 Tax=Limnohabitans parvus II-B4 TaxID=1293052 RepID=A0A315EDK7_9BURK|nr:gephyrin-like molybdotransferase Glp [Limnohabitans parvus]PUE55189.1 molybdopterin molybdenumtransferase MoeA [Limnohabitans parvus II-B4]
MTTAPRAPLMSLDEALKTLLAQISPLMGVESVATLDADGRILAQDLVSALQVPAFDNSSMDGYAVRSTDVQEAGIELTVTQRIAAGHFGQPLLPGEAARIFTGAPVPPGADAIVMQEQTEPMSADAPNRVRFLAPAAAGQWVRRSGEDVRMGDAVLKRGQKLGPAELGLAASLGLAHLEVMSRPKVALFSTGDELVMPGEVAPADMPPGAIYNSNRFFLRALLHRLGCEVSDLGIVPDRREATIAALKTAADHHDLIVTSGGVSVGEEDHVKPAVQALGALALWQIAMKPGKPFAYGHVRRESAPGMAHFVGLPGNPVSSFMTFLLLVKPVILALQGAEQRAPVCMPVPAHFDVPKADKRREFLRVRRNAQGGLDLFPNQSSGVLTSVVWGDGVVDNPAGQTIAHGDLVSFWPFAEWLS